MRNKEVTIIPLRHETVKEYIIRQRALGYSNEEIIQHIHRYYTGISDEILALQKEENKL